MTDEELANLCITLINQATKAVSTEWWSKGTNDKGQAEVEEREWGMMGDEGDVGPVRLV